MAVMHLLFPFLCPLGCLILLTDLCRILLLVFAVRSIVFVLRRNVQLVEPEVCGLLDIHIIFSLTKGTGQSRPMIFCNGVPQIIQHVLLDMPGLAFFTTYALLVLFWAEIYYQVLDRTCSFLYFVLFHQCCCAC